MTAASESRRDEETKRAVTSDIGAPRLVVESFMHCAGSQAGDPFSFAAGACWAMRQDPSDSEQAAMDAAARGNPERPGMAAWNALSSMRCRTDGGRG